MRTTHGAYRKGWGPDGYTALDEEESADPMPEAKTQANFPKCDVYAWNLARENGVDPRGEDGVDWSNNLTVNEIYQQHYAGEVDTTPETGNAGKSGYLFFDWASEPGSAKNHMEYCEISADGLSYTQWYTDGTTAPVPHTSTSGIVRGILLLQKQIGV